MASKPQMEFQRPRRADRSRPSPAAAKRKKHSNNHTRMHRAQRGGASKLRSAAAEGLQLRGAAPVRDRPRWGDDQTACAHRQGTRVEGAQGGIGRYGIELILAAADKVGVILAASVCPASPIHPQNRGVGGRSGVSVSGCGYGWRLCIGEDEYGGMGMRISCGRRPERWCVTAHVNSIQRARGV